MFDYSAGLCSFSTTKQQWQTPIGENGNRPRCMHTCYPVVPATGLRIIYQKYPCAISCNNTTPLHHIVKVGYTCQTVFHHGTFIFWDLNCCMYIPIYLPFLILVVIAWLRLKHFYIKGILEGIVHFFCQKMIENRFYNTLYIISNLRYDIGRSVVHDRFLTNWLRAVKFPFLLYRGLMVRELIMIPQTPKEKQNIQSFLTSAMLQRLK